MSLYLRVRSTNFFSLYSIVIFPAFRIRPAA